MFGLFGKKKRNKADQRNAVMRGEGRCEIVEEYRETELHFSGGQKLGPGSFELIPDDRNIQRIIIDDFSVIEPHTFEGFTAVREVFFNASHVTVGSKAFAHCFSLGKVIPAEGIEAAEDAFLDTPYKAYKDGRGDYVPGYMVPQYLQRGESGYKVLAQLRKDIEYIYDAILFRMIPRRYQKDPGPLFKDSVRLICEGALAGEPALLYLIAEILHFSGNDLIQDPDYRSALSPILDEEPVLTDKEWYMRAAKAGSPHAILWCAYCMDQGIEGFDRDCTAAEAMLAECRDVPMTLDLVELAFLRTKIDKLYHEYNERDYIQDVYEVSMDPSPETLKKYIEAVSLFMADLGLSAYAPYPFLFDPDFFGFDGSDKADHIHLVKTQWKAWCRSHGMKVW